MRLYRSITFLLVLLPAPALAVPAPSRALTTVFVIAMENHNWSDIRGNRSAPFINETLAPLAAHAEAYYDPNVHPSLPNYLWFEAGTSFHITADLSPARVHQSTTNHLVTLLNREHISWRAYEEGISGTVCPLTNRNRYAVKHNPMVYFDDTTNRNNPRSAYCIAHERPFTTFASDLSRSRVARYNFITPNLCNDMHDACAPSRNEIKQGDSWLSGTVPAILASRAYRQGGVIFLLWDEGTNDSDGPLPMFVISPDARRGYSNDIRYTHSSTLRTIEEIFDLKPMLGGAAQSNDLRDLFIQFP
jgi:hypothetical protein